MSGAIFTSLEGPGALDGTSGHPLVCPLCHAQYERPCLLDCFHEFCAGCLRGRAADGRLACPLCQHQTVVKGPSGLPPVDRLLQFLVDSSGDGTEVVRCANCDLECGKQDAETTYFCNTCGQPLCARCRDETHRARMFARHDIVALGQRSRDVLQKCRGEGPADRHTRGHRAAAGDGGRSATQRGRGGGRHPGPLQQHAGQTVREERAAAAGRAEVHLVICSSFLSLANKAEFLDLGYELMERLQGIVTRPHRLRPAQSSKITSDHRAEFARCLEPLLLLGPRRAAGAGGGTSTLTGGSGPKVLRGPSCPSPVGKMLGSPVQKPTLHRSISTKVLLAEGDDSPFTEHCRHYEDSYRRLQAEMQNLKDQVQELHRDLTKHHSLIKAEIMGDILHKALQVDAQIASEYASVEGLRAVFQEIWEDSYQRVANEQEIYEAQLHDLLQLKQENAYLTTITKQITPYVRSIAKVKERLEPRFQVPVDEPSDHPQNTHDDGVNAEAPARSDPVSVAEKKEKNLELRNSRALGSLAEEPPLKNKDAHRPKSKNGGDVPTWREHPA
ncbi:RING finger protein 207 isoform X7 [Bubalus bubalis]|uniref:RING finger protein 207 isoform X7 n=1 Tax=Bubalus bubalis TaxID=89462 RepID=UPI000DBC4EDB|nr:RING finger protein 207 isoform X7 [Bubalus bubalis]